MLAPSKTRFGLPDVLSTIAGIRPFAVEKASLIAGLDGLSRCPIWHVISYG